MRRVLAVIALALLAASCQTMTTPGTSQDLFLVFFHPASADLTPEAQEIIRQAARNTMSLRATKVNITIPPDEGRPLAEERFTAIQNILSASGVNAGLLERTALSEMAARLPGAADRAEIRLIK